MEELLKEIHELIDQQARSLVGILLKRVELLNAEDSLNPNIYKSIAKELVYENFRSLKKMLDLRYRVGKIEFVPPTK